MANRQASFQLLAWAVGDFEFVEARTERKYNGKSIPVRVYTTRGLKEQARFALECARRIVDYFSGVFELTIPFQSPISLLFTNL